MAKMRLMKPGHGDLCVAEWDVDKEESVEAAEEAFRAHVTAGRLAFRTDPARPGFSEPVFNFDKYLEEILIVPAITGG